MAKITITGIDGNGGLILDDHGKTYADHNEEVSWHVKPGSGVDSIVDIDAKGSTPSVNIWANDPDQVGNSNIWKGTIKANGVDGKEWNYYIDWEDQYGQTQHFDPKIIVNTTVGP